MGRSRGRLKRALLVVALVVAVVCVGGAGAAYIWYDKATAPDRSAPDVSVDNYLRELLVYRNDTRANDYACHDQSGLADIKGLRTYLDTLGRQFSASVDVSWGPLSVTHTANGANVQVQLTLAVPVRAGLVTTTNQNWLFAVINSSGWRVCDARKTS